MRLPDGDHLDGYERYARGRLTPLLGHLRVTDTPGGPEGTHDFEADLADGSVAALEVTSEVDGQRLSLGCQAQRRFSSLRLSNSQLLWLVGLAADAKVSRIKPNDLLQLLGDLEAGGKLSVRNLGDYRDPAVTRLRALQIESVYGSKAKTGREGTVVVRPGVYGGFGWSGLNIDNWLRDLLASSRGVNKLTKLGRATAAERHLVIVLDSFSEAGMGILVGLQGRHEHEGPRYEMPSSQPPQPLTHLWIMPMDDAWEGLRWKRGDGWSVLAASWSEPAL